MQATCLNGEKRLKLNFYTNIFLLCINFSMIYCTFFTYYIYCIYGNNPMKEMVEGIAIFYFSIMNIL